MADGGNDSVKAKPSESSGDKASEPSEDNAEKKMDNIDELVRIFAAWSR